MACKHPVYDTDKHFIIDSITKKISTESPKIVIPQHTHKSERFTFEIPRMVEGHDMSLSNVVEIHFQNVSAADKKIKSVGIQKAESLEVVGDNVVCSWLIEGDATMYDGILMFALHYSCVQDGTVQYNLPTLSYTAISIGATVWNSETIAWDYRDVIAEFEERISALEGGGSADPEEIKKIVTEYGLPVLHLTGDTTGMSKDNAVSLDYVYGERSGTAKVKWQGASSLAYPKKNYTIQFDNAFEAVEGWGEQKKYCLKANYIDFSHARNVVSAKLWGEIVKSRKNTNAKLSALPNGGAVDGFPCIVMLNGAFHGLYTFNIPKDGWMYGMGNGGMNVERLSFKEYVDGEIDKTTGEYTPTDRVVAEFVTERNISTAGGRTYINWDVSKVSHIGARAYLFDMDGNLVKAFSGYNGVEWNPYYGNYEGDLGEDAWLDVSENTTRLDEAWEVKPLSLPVPKNHYVMWMFTHNNIAIPETSDLTTAWSAEAEANNTWSYSWARTGIEFTYQSAANEIIVCADVNGASTRFKAAATLSGDFDLEYASETVNEEDVLSFLNCLITACINSDGTDLDSNIAKYLDWDSAIDYYIFTCLIGGADMAGKNYLLSTYDGTKWFFGAYDMDSTFGLWWDGTQFLPDNHYPTVEWYADYHRAMWLIWNYKRDALKARYAELRAGALSENNVALVFSNFINKIPSTVYTEDAKKWPGIPSTAANNLAQILNWYRMRVAVLDKEMESV